MMKVNGIVQGTRKLKAGWTVNHSDFLETHSLNDFLHGRGMDRRLDEELAKILSAEITNEIDQEIMKELFNVANKEKEIETQKNELELTREEFRILLEEVEKSNGL